MSPLDNEEKMILDTMKAIAKTFGKIKEFQDFSRGIKRAKANAEKGLTKEAAKEFAALQKRYPEFHKLGRIVTNLYHEGLHDGRHAAGLN